jgi:hypothetical protein
MLISSKRAGVAHLVEHLIRNPYTALSQYTPCTEIPAKMAVWLTIGTPRISIHLLDRARHGARHLTAHSALGNVALELDMPWTPLSLFCGVALVALMVFGVFWMIFRYLNRGKGYFFFDPQDCFNAKIQGRILPKAAETGTFEPMLKHYLTVMQLIVTVAVASIAFGNGSPQLPAIKIAKLLVAWSIAYGVAFCAILLWRYDEYTQDMTSYTLPWYATVFSLGFSSLTCFTLGFLAWGWGLL